MILVYMQGVVCSVYSFSLCSVQIHKELVRLDEQELNNKYKIGVLYCKRGQTTEEEIYNNGGYNSKHYVISPVVHVHVHVFGPSFSELHIDELNAISILILLILCILLWYIHCNLFLEAT